MKTIAARRLCVCAAMDSAAAPLRSRPALSASSSGSFAPGSLEDDNKTQLEEGMTFIIHPNQYLPETGYLTLGDTVVMTQTKAESLMRSSWDIYIKD